MLQEGPAGGPRVKRDESMHTKTCAAVGQIIPASRVSLNPCKDSPAHQNGSQEAPIHLIIRLRRTWHWQAREKRGLVPGGKSASGGSQTTTRPPGPGARKQCVAGTESQPRGAMPSTAKDRRRAQLYSKTWRHAQHDCLHGTGKAVGGPAQEQQHKQGKPHPKLVAGQCMTAGQTTSQMW